MRFIIVLFAILIVTNAKFFKLWKKKAYLSNLSKSGSSDKSSERDSKENRIPENGVPVLIIPLETTLHSPLQYYSSIPIATSSVQYKLPYSHHYQYSVAHNPISVQAHITDHEYHQNQQIPIIIPESTELIKSPENLSNEWVPKQSENLYTEWVSKAPESSEPSATSSSDATSTLSSSQYNLSDGPSYNYQTILPVTGSTSYTFIPGSINDYSLSLLQKNQLVPTNSASSVSSNSYTGEYETSYMLKDGTLVTENSKLIDGKSGNKILVKNGTYQRKGENGEIITVKWVADEGGFRVLES